MSTNLQIRFTESFNKGFLDPTIVALLKRLQDITDAGEATFHDMNENPLAELRILDHLHADYSLLMDAIRRLHNACAKYCHRCHRIQRAPPPPDDPQLESDALADLTQFTARCREVRTCIDDALARWDDTTPALHDDLDRRARTAWLPWPLSSAPARRRTLLADLPSLQTNAAHNLRQLGDAYDALDRTVSQIEPARTSVDAASLKTAIYALIALDIAFLDYQYGFRQVDQRLHMGHRRPGLSVGYRS